MPDSYDLLARSIERVVRNDLLPPVSPDLPSPISPDVLVGSIDRIMAEEARGGERRLAYLRVLLVGAYVALVADALFRGPPAPADPPRVALAVLAAGWMAFAIGLAVALRGGWYRRWVPHFMPVIDAGVIASGFLVPLYTSPRGVGAPSPDALASLTALCAFLSISGGLRLSRSSARVGTALSVIVFVVAALSAGLRVVPTAAVAVALLAVGLLSTSMATLVRRVVTDEIAKATLSQLYADAKQAVDAREQVLKIVSHDLRNPLHTIAMGASLMLDVDMPPEKRREQLQRIRRAGERMARLVRDLLDVAKLEAGRVAIAPRELEVGPLLREAHDMLEPLAAEASLALDLEVSGNLPSVSADADRLMQVLSNLVGNAIKFTPAGGRITIGARRSVEGVEFSVRDTGPGISPDKVERIFTRFWQADAADRRGIGLGLTIAKGIMDAHGGRLWVESRVGEGTTFRFVLPGATTPSTPATPRGTKTIGPDLAAPAAGVSNSTAGM